MTGSLRPRSGRERLILAVDTPTVDEARRLIDELYEYVGVFKIGLEMIMNEGPQVLEKLGRDSRHFKVFFDAKLHDIPNTVAKAMEGIARLGVQMVTVHASGGSAMLKAAAQASLKAAEFGQPVPMVLGVTVLTSLDQAALNEELRVAGSVQDQVLNLVRVAANSGVNGIVCSPEEVAAIRSREGDSLVLVIPGVRPKWAATNDQSRIMTPADALAAGADYLVVGRPITAAADRKDAARRIVEEMDGVRA